MSSEELPPELSGRFEVTRLLGRGAFGRVLAAQDRELDRKVAIKFLAPLTHDQSLESRFLREAKATGRLHHPGIVGVFDHGIGEDGTRWIVYEYVEGHDLGRLLMLEDPITCDQVQSWGVTLAEALAHAHSLGVLHRDLKPGNVLVTAEGKAKLCDFGLARLTDGNGNETQTRTGMLLGTPAYLSPEIFRGVEHNPYSDQFGLAATLYEALSGAPVQPPEDVREILAGKSPPLRFSPDIDQRFPAFTAVLKRALATNPRQRFTDLGAFAAALGDPDGAAAQALSSEELSLLRPRRYRPQGPWRGILLTGVLATCLGVGLFLPRTGAPEATPPPSTTTSPQPVSPPSSDDARSGLSDWDAEYRASHGYQDEGGFSRPESAEHRRNHRGELLDPRHSLRLTRLFQELLHWATPEVLDAARVDQHHLFWRLDTDFAHLLDEAEDFSSRLFDIDYVRTSGAGGKRLESAEQVQTRVDEFQDALGLFFERARASPVADHPCMLVLELRAAQYLPGVPFDAAASALLNRLDGLAIGLHGNRALGVLASGAWRLRGSAPPSEATRHQLLARFRKYLVTPPRWADSSTRRQLLWDVARFPFGHALRRITPPTDPELRSWEQLLSTLEAAAAIPRDLAAITPGAEAVRGLRKRSQHRTHAQFNAILDRLEALIDRARIDSQRPDSE